MLRRVIAAVVFTAAVGATASAQNVKPPEIEFGRYHALVIGNNDYRHLPKLNTAVGDSDAVATLLEEKYGFRVTKLTTATRLDITGAFNRLRQSLTEKDNLLVYYAGHGVLDEEASAGYWLPVDARQDDDSKWFSNTRRTGATRLTMLTPRKGPSRPSGACGAASSWRRGNGGNGSSRPWSGAPPTASLG